MLIFVLFLFLISCKQASYQQEKEKSRVLDTISKEDLNIVADSLIKLPQGEKELELVENEIIGFGEIQKAKIFKKDSLFWVDANINRDYQIFGYEQPDTSARKLIVFSVFTYDVQDNPYQCPLGAYYGSYNLENSQIKYKGELVPFIITDFIEDDKVTPIYFEKNSVEFVE